MGCPIYIHIPKEKWTKPKPSRKKGIFVKYSEPSIGYINYVLGQRIIEINRDAKVKEEISFNLTKNIGESYLEPTTRLDVIPPLEYEREIDSRSLAPASPNIDNTKKI